MPLLTIWKKDHHAATVQRVKRLSIAWKATVHSGDVSRGGLTRGEYEACEHDLGLKEQYIPCGMVEEDGGQLHLTCGSASKTRACIVDPLEAWWAAWDETEPVAMARFQSTRDNGPESRGKRTPFLPRMRDNTEHAGNADGGGLTGASS